MRYPSNQSSGNRQDNLQRSLTLSKNPVAFRVDRFISSAGLRFEIKEYYKQLNGTLFGDWPVSLTEGQTPGASMDLNDKKSLI